MQSRLASALEVAANYISGFLLAWAVWQFAAMPMLAWLHANHAADSTVGLAVTSLFTGVSVCRSYFWRRMFNRIHAHKAAQS